MQNYRSTKMLFHPIIITWERHPSTTPTKKNPITTTIMAHKNKANFKITRIKLHVTSIMIILLAIYPKKNLSANVLLQLNMAL